MDLFLILSNQILANLIPHSPRGDRKALNVPKLLCGDRSILVSGCRPGRNRLGSYRCCLLFHVQTDRNHASLDRNFSDEETELKNFKFKTPLLILQIKPLQYQHHNETWLP